MVKLAEHVERGFSDGMLFRAAAEKDMSVLFGYKCQSLIDLYIKGACVSDASQLLEWSNGFVGGFAFTGLDAAMTNPAYKKALTVKIEDPRPYAEALTNVKIVLSSIADDFCILRPASPGRPEE